MFEEQSFDRSALEKLTEKLPETKKVPGGRKVLLGKERASIRALYLPLRVIYLSKGFDIN